MSKTMCSNTCGHFVGSKSINAWQLCISLHLCSRIYIFSGAWRNQASMAFIYVSSKLRLWKQPKASFSHTRPPIHKRNTCKVCDNLCLIIYLHLKQDYAHNCVIWLLNNHTNMWSGIFVTYCGIKVDFRCILSECSQLIIHDQQVRRCEDWELEAKFQDGKCFLLKGQGLFLLRQISLLFCFIL